MDQNITASRTEGGILFVCKYGYTDTLKKNEVLGAVSRRKSELGQTPSRPPPGLLLLKSPSVVLAAC